MITIITGIPGAGKTSYMAKLAVDCILNCRADYLACKREFNTLNDTGCKLDLPPQKHLVYCDTSITYGRRYSSYDIDGFCIGVASPLFTTSRFIPPYSSIFLDEAQRYYDSRMSKYLREEVYRWYQLHRHGDYNVYMACQRLGNIDINLRAIAERFLVMDKVDVRSNEFGVVSRVTWNYHEFTSGDIAEKYQLASDNPEYAKMGIAVKESIDYNIFRCYNSKSARPVFYKNIINSNLPVDYYTEEGYQFTRESFVEFNNNHYFTAPLGFWKNTERDKKILKDLGVTNYDY